MTEPAMFQPREVTCNPREWTKLLELDKTKTAVLLQYALAEALTVVPHLVLEALDRKPFLLAKPIRF